MTIRSVAVAALFSALVAPTTVLATTAQRTFVASTGSDVHPCSLSQPCRSFGAAIAKTSDAGEVIVLDSAGYGPVTITKSVSIVAPVGVYAGITVTSGNGVTVDGAGILVELRGLSINGLGGFIGIRFLQGAHLLIDGCAITLFDNGISLEAANSGVSIRSSRIYHSGASGVVVGISTGGTQVSIVDSEIADNPFGVQVGGVGTTQVTVAHSTLTRNGAALTANGETGGNASILSDGNTITYSAVAFSLGDFGGVRAIFPPGNNTVGYYSTLVEGGVLTPCCGV
jgi:hypothetical protein